MIRTAERIRAWLMKTYLNHLPTLWRVKTATALEGAVPDCCNLLIGYLLNPATSLNGILLSDSILYLAPAIPLCRKPGLIDNHLYKYDQKQGRPNTYSEQWYYPVEFQIKKYSRYLFGIVDNFMEYYNKLKNKNLYQLSPADCNLVFFKPRFIPLISNIDPYMTQ